MPKQADPNSKKSRIIAMFKANPDLKAADVAAEFEMAVANVYTYKSIAANGEPVKKPKLVVPDAPAPGTRTRKNGASEPYVPEPQPASPPWQLELQLPRSEFIGYLRGTIIALVSSASAQGSNVSDLTNAKVCLEKLIEVV